MKRILCLILVASLLFGILPAQALATPVDQGPTPLTGDGINLPEGAEGTFLAFASSTASEGTPLASWTLEEQGRYALTVYRAGDLDGETTVELRTIDISAAYGRDYVVDDPRYETAASETEGTLMEQYSVSEAAQAEARQTLDEVSAAAEADDAAPLPEEARPAEGEGAEKSALAKRKEEQTGLPSRETPDAALLPMNEDLVSGLIPDLGASVETSSSTALTFRRADAGEHLPPRRGSRDRL